MNNKRLPYADMILIFGAVAVTFLFAGCIFIALLTFSSVGNALWLAISFASCALIASASGIVAILLGNKAIAAYNEEPSPEVWYGFGKLKVGRICACVSVILSVLLLVATALIIGIFGFEKLNI
jgi:hypothetical protein